MVVRFLPAQGDEEFASGGSERADLAEVIDLRSRLRPPAAAASGGAPDRDGVPPAVPLRAEPMRPTGVAAHEASAASPSAVVDDGVRLLARRARSSGELRRELAALGHATHDIEAAILQFEGSLYLDDVGLARAVAEGLRERKRASRLQIRRKLRDRLIPDDAIERVLAEFDDDGEDVLLREAASDRARRLAALDRQTAERRLLGFLARRGWTGERATRVAREALDAAAARGTVRFR